MMTSRGFLTGVCAGVAVAFALSAPVAAQARDYPFCIKGDGYESAVGDCSFDTYEQCKATASGRLAYCDANPFYRPGYNSVRHPGIRRGKSRR